MKRINTNNSGRMPLWQKDLDWMQRGYTEPIEALIASLGSPMTHFIIGGCSPYRPDPAHIAMDAGWFCWGGKALPVRKLPPTTTAGFANPVVRLTLVHHANPDGARAFVRADLTVHQVDNVWQDDYLQPSLAERSDAFTSGVRLGVGAWTLPDIISRRNRQGESPWTTLTGDGGNVRYKRVGQLVVVNATLLSERPVSGLPLPVTDPTIIDFIDRDHYTLLQGDTLTYYGGAGSGILPPTAVIHGKTYIADTPYTEPATDPNTINDEPQA